MWCSQGSILQFSRCFSFFTVWVFEFCYHLSFWVLSPFEFLNFWKCSVVTYGHCCKQVHNTENTKFPNEPNNQMCVLGAINERYEALFNDNKQVGTKSHCLGSNILPYRLIFCPRIEEKKCTPPNFLEKIVLITRIWRTSVFRVWQLSTLVPIKVSVSGLTELHTPQQTSSFIVVSKKQPLFKSVTKLNSMF